MNILRKTFLALLSALFVFLLFATAFDVGFVRTATHPATVKKLVADSGIYNSVIDTALKQENTISTSLGSVELTDPIVQKAANQAVTPQYVQQQAEAAIDNVYQWLNGDIAQPNFNINLAGQKSDFAAKAASSIETQLAALPACTTAGQVQTFSALNATCLPPSVTPQAAAAQIEASLNSSDFLSQANISAANVKNQDTGTSVFDTPKAKNIPKKYQLAKKTPFIFAILTILCGVGIVFLSKTWQIGLRHIGINMVVIGLFMLVLAFVLPRVISTEVAPKLHLNGADIKINLENVVNDITQQIDKNYWFFGAIYTIVGGGAIIGSEYHRRKTAPAPVPAAASHQTDHDTEGKQKAEAVDK